MSKTPSIPQKFWQSPSQERLWFLAALDGADTGYHVVGAFEIAGVLDSVALREAIHAVERRHPALCAVFPFDKEPMQHIRPPGRLELEQHTDPAAIPNWLVRPFDLEKGPPARAGLWRLSPTRHILALAFHHIVCDHQSWRVVLRDLSAFYRQAMSGGTISVEPDIRYANCVLREREIARRLPSGLPGRLGATTLPALRLPPADTAPDGRPDEPARREFALDRHQLTRLRRLASGLATTPFVVLLAGYALLVGCLGAADEVLLTSPMSTRDPMLGEDVVGCFVNLSLLRIPLDLNQPARALIKQVDGQIMEALADRMRPYQNIVGELRKAGLITTARVPQHVSFNLIDDETWDRPELPGTEISVYAVPPPGLRNSLSCMVALSGGGAAVTILYDRRKLRAAGVRQLIDAYPVVLDRMYKMPSGSLTELLAGTGLLG